MLSKFKSAEAISSPKVSIIILNWNNLNDTIECLGSLRKTNYPNYEIIVVDNGSTDGVPERIKSLFPEVSIIRNTRNLGFAEGNNVGIKYALKNCTRYLWLLNNDTVIPPDTLGKLVHTAEKSPTIGLLSPIIYYKSMPYKIQYCGSFFNWSSYSVIHIQDLDNIKLVRDKDFCLWGTALFIKREVVETIGFLNEKYFAYWEDFEYSLRVLRAGYLNAIDTSAKILHKLHVIDNFSNNRFPLHYFYYMSRNKYWFWKENIRFRQKLSFLRKYLARIIENINFYKESGDFEHMNAHLDGMYCAFRNIGGSWDNRKSAPKIFRNFILWHPYLWADIIEGNFKKIIVGSLKRASKNYKF